MMKGGLRLFEAESLDHRLHLLARFVLDRANHELAGDNDSKVGSFRATNNNDILAILSPEVQGFGFFQNVGSTRRQGVEAEVTLKSRTLQFYASYVFVDSRFLDALQVQSNSPFAVDEQVQIHAGSGGNRVGAAGGVRSEPLEFARGRSKLSGAQGKS
jgi:hypothetical protein